MIEKGEINKFAKDFMEQRLGDNLKRMQKTLQTEGKSISREFTDPFDRLFRKCLEQQKKGKKKAIRYIHIFYLKSAMLTQKLEYQINAYTEMSYMDETECMELWYPSFIMDYYKRDIEELDKEAKKRVVRYAYPQLRELQERWYSVYTVLVGQYIMQAAGEIVNLDSYKDMEKDDAIQIIYGGYMDKGIQIWPQTILNQDDGEVK